MKDCTLHLIIAFLLGVIITLICIGVFGPTNLPKEAIELGYARYNPTNAHWEWIKQK